MIRQLRETARDNPLVRGGLMIGFGIVLGNAVGFIRVAVTAYLLGTHARADALAVAIGPIDTLNSVLINTMVFAFVPMLMLREGGERIALFRRVSRIFSVFFATVSLLMIIGAPALIRAIGPGLAANQVPVAINILRITALSTLAAGSAAIQSAWLFTERRFGPTAFNQACLNVFTIAGALSLWKVLGIYGFAIGYTFGACVQFTLVYLSARKSHRTPGTLPAIVTPWAELIAKPGSFLIYAGLIALNLIVTRAYATQSGSGMAAAFDYCTRCVNVVVAYLVSPLSNSMLPEIARLRGSDRSQRAFQTIDKTIRLVAVAAIASCVAGVILRGPVIALLFQRGNFTAESTRLVSGAFLGFAPAIIGWSLLELTSRSLFALNRPWIPLCAASVPVIFNLLFSAGLRARGLGNAEFIGLGASLGLLLGFGVLSVMGHLRRKHWHDEALPQPESQPEELVLAQ